MKSKKILVRKGAQKFWVKDQKKIKMWEMLAIHALDPPSVEVLKRD